MKSRRSLCFLVILLLVAPSIARALTGERYVTFSGISFLNFTLVERNAAAPIWVDAAELPGVTRAAHDLQSDIERVTGAHASLGQPRQEATPNVVIIGTIGHCALIDELVRRGKLNVDPIRGQWESWIREVVRNPLPGVKRALVIAGSDKRGTIYGIYDLSEQMGVSPWYWWADVTPDHHDAVYVATGRFVQHSPSVKYRGIFLNDEAPDLTGWVTAKFGNAPVRQDPPVPAGIANYGHEFYARMFEVLLRLRGNYLWPAMWNNAFNEDDPQNAQLADEYGVVMGNSHQEPMLRAQKEWDRRYLKTIGTWNYATHPQVLEDFWREGVRRNKNFESLVTMGLRGANDTEMAPGGPPANRALLEKIVDVQRGILAQEINPDITKVPQLWCLYKEVQDYYEAGMRVPDDVTLLWAEDNWGNVRRLPTAEELKRSGGAGVYYHFDYHGGPRNYQWLNTSPLPKIWEQMSLAKQYGADRIWIVNVGHFKGYEVPTEFFLDFAWDTNRWNNANTGEFLRRWARREFGPGYKDEIADIVAKYAKYNGRRKPEMLAPSTYSLVNYREAETVVADYDALAARAEKLNAALPASKHDAFYELVLFPTKASALVNDLYLAAGRNELYAKQGRVTANDMLAETQRLFQADLDLMAYFNNTFANGRWNHFMDQTHLGYTTWRDPPKNLLDAIKLTPVTAADAGALGVAVEGSESAWPDAAEPAKLPRFDAVNRQKHYFEVFNRGKAALSFAVKSDVPWVKSSETGGTIGPDHRIWVDLDWNAVPKDHRTGTITVSAGGVDVAIAVEALNPAKVNRKSLKGFVETDGFVSIEPAHYTRKIDAGNYHWTEVSDYGRTLSGMRAEAPPHGASLTPGRTTPVLEYRMYLFTAGSADVTAITAPTLNFVPDRGLCYAVSIDDETPQVITLVPKGYRAQNSNHDWEKVVGDNARLVHSKHTIDKPGYHTLKLWMVDPAVVLQKLVVDLGGLKPTYLGPPESLRSK
jgi:hypothetical protein